MLFLCSVLAIPVSIQMSLALTWLYFSLDSFYFQPANIHFIPEVSQHQLIKVNGHLFLQDAIQTEETESRTTHLSESETPTRPQITWKLEPLQQVVAGNLSRRSTFGRDDINALKLSSGDRLITRRRHRQCNAIPDQSDEVTSDPCEPVVRKTFLMSVSQAQFTEAKQEESVSSKLGAG